jgi:hypothetical protein
VYFCWLDVLERAGDGARASIVVRIEDETLVFEAGIDPGAPDRVPLSSLDRIEALGGRLATRTEPGGTTLVSGALPLSR